MRGKGPQVQKKANPIISTPKEERSTGAEMLGLCKEGRRLFRGVGKKEKSVTQSSERYA